MQFSTDPRTSRTLDVLDTFRRRRYEILTDYNNPEMSQRQFNFDNKESKIYDEDFVNPYDIDGNSKNVRFGDGELQSTDYYVPVTDRSIRNLPYNDQHLSLPTPNAGKTTSEVYGSFLPGWRHTFVTQTPPKLKNRRLDMIKKAVPITSREYGIYYADRRYTDDVVEERLRDDYDLRSKIDMAPRHHYDRYKPYSKHSNLYDYDVTRLPPIHPARWPETYRSMADEPRYRSNHDYSLLYPETYRSLVDDEPKSYRSNNDFGVLNSERSRFSPGRSFSPERIKLPPIKDVDVRFEDGTSARMSPENFRDFYLSPR